MASFQIHILKIQTLNIIGKVVLFCKITATHFKHVIVFDKLQERERDKKAQLLLSDWNRVTEYGIDGNSD